MKRRRWHCPAPRATELIAYSHVSSHHIAVLEGVYVGLTTSACLASLGHRVVAADLIAGYTVIDAAAVSTTPVPVYAA